MLKILSNKKWLDVLLTEDTNLLRLYASKLARKGFIVKVE